jgi:hypothetical protein
MYNTVPNFNLKKFFIPDIVENASICVIASRGSGKSYLVREILYNFRHLSTVVIAPTDRMSGFYDDFVPSSYIYYEYSSDLLTKIFKRQMDLIEKNKRRIKNGKKPIDARLFLVMDDCLASKSAWMKDQNILELLQNGRHYLIYNIIVAQYALSLSVELRSNFDYIFLLGEDFVSNRKRLYEQFCGMFASFDMFQRVFSKVTNNFGCMVVNNRKKGGAIHEKVFWYRAKKTPKFMIGNNKYLDFHEKYYNPEWNKVKKEFNVEDYLCKKQKLIMDVKLEE